MHASDVQTDIQALESVSPVSNSLAQKTKDLPTSDVESIVVSYVLKINSFGIYVNTCLYNLDYNLHTT